ncbi:Dps family protein [Gryllotalpicola ginsengisoli]|uniref:Dps family protein n=1 Tax=Gryllotalpicola ginsengisoli TaxID=444608 RepID=UPI0003B7A0B7|nr:DNA starvation/stationary phase protection protein [Gryllotalpicola ginsengisoli]
MATKTAKSTKAETATKSDVAVAEPTVASVDTETASSVAQYLSPVVIDLEALSINGKQAHWHVRGLNFIAVHELIDDVVDHAREFADLAAERVVALGLPVDARIETVAAKNTLPPMADGFQQSNDVIATLVDSIDAALATVRKAVEGLDEIDPNSQDVATEIERGLTKDRWFLVAHIAA